MLRAARRRLLISGLALLPSCYPLYKATHRADGPLGFDVRAVQDVLRTQHGFSAGEEIDEHSAYCSIGQWPVWVYVACHTKYPPPNGAVFIGSAWLDDLPSDDVLFESIALQQEVVALLARTVPGFPSPDAFRLEWIGLDGPHGDEFAAAKARWEASAGKR